ncbi:carboxypeptidase regulatory-like domain-containing protein [Leptolyngbya sp. 7M]|uniref:carboxypeptidase regulatory-like domain-containing protein n=1 Tax=Leptolyngbya sp. 7M TaxID=2812896 RepID=UPI001B8AC00C|nr:carboxypeptidase regulatory-like domain-containing protein [Leptolyngbya sp. 7M]QYO66383.1 carboxypeptidase regulatory-like domain-containing protein [Leptolyngbya sp. 7M]
MGNQTLKKAVAAFGVMVCACIFAIGQGTTSRVTGTVTDSAGAAIAGATVTLTNEGTNVSLTTTTSNTGQYVFDLVQAGTYSVSVEKDGFKRFVSSRNTVLINQPATVNVSLEIGEVTAVIEVGAVAEQVQTSSSGNIGGTVEQRTIESLPIVGTRGRNPLDILNFQPGISTGANTGGGVHIHGSRDRAFNFTLDGIDINESTAGGSNFTPLRPNPDSIQEFQVVTSAFTAELGRSSGAQVTLVTRSGTNQFRGSLFEYYQTKGFMARSYPANVNGTDKENFIQHIFGGSFGGPLFNPGFGEGTKPFSLLRDRAFFFVNLQMLRASDALLQTRTVYTQAVRQGVFRWLRGGVNGPGTVDANGNPIAPPCSSTVTTNCIDSYNIPTGTGISLDPTLMAYINRMPLPNSFSATGDGLNIAGYLFNSPQREEQYDFVAKFDFKLNNSNNFYIRWAQGEQNTIGDAANAGRPRFPGGDSYRVDTFRKPKNVAFNWRSSPTATFTNEFLFGYSDFSFSFTNPNADPNHAFVFNLPTDYNSNFTYNARSFRTLQFVDNMTFDLSPHVLKAGTNIRLGRSNDDRSSVAGGAIEGAFNFSRTVNSTFPAAWNLPTGAAVINSADRTRLENVINDVLGRVGTISQAFVNDPSNPSTFAPGGTRWIFDADHPEVDFYVQDTWKWRPNFTVDFGVRWEIRLAPRAAGGRPILVPDRPVVLGSAPSNAIRWTEGKLFDDDYGMFLPTLGFAWDPFKDGKTSVRMNYRKASDRFSTFLFSSFIFQSTPGNNALGSNTAFGQGGGLLRNGLPSVVPTQSPDQLRTPVAFSTASTTVIDPDIKFPSVHNWTASFQRELWGANVFEFNYIGKKATNLFGTYNVNQVNLNGTLPGTGETFLQAFNSIRGSSTYNSPLINLLFTGNANNNAGTTLFRSLNATAITQGSIATLALAASQRLCLAADVTAGRCTNANLNQQLIGVHGFSSFFQPFSQFTGGLNVVDSNDFSFYNGLEFIMKRRMRQGISYQVGYTYAISKDTRSFDPVFTTLGTGTTQTAANTPLDNNNRKLLYAWSDFDRRHSLLGTYVVELPFGSGKALRAENSVLNYIISGWQLAGTVRMTSGRPFSVFSGLNTISQTSGSFANCNGCPRDLGKLVQGNFDNPSSPLLRNWWFDQAARGLFSQPGPGEVGNTGRNYFIGPKYWETDMSLSRNFRFTETVSFDVRVDARNLTNTPNFSFPSAVLPAGFSQTGYGSSIFGRINADVTNSARRVQISGKLNF